MQWNQRSETPGPERGHPWHPLGIAPSVRLHGEGLLLALPAVSGLRFTPLGPQPLDEGCESHHGDAGSHTEKGEKNPVALDGEILGWGRSMAMSTVAATTAP